jgi:plasmid stabilization system protein ParE
MTRPWRLSSRAHADLDRVLDFSRPQSTRAASRVRTRIVEALRLISEHPRVGTALGGATRQLVTRLGRNAYVIRYRLTADEIVITRIWHGKENRPR